MKRLRMMAILAVLVLAVAASSSSGQSMPYPDPWGPSDSSASSGQHAPHPYYYGVPQYEPIHDMSGRIVGYHLYHNAYSSSGGYPEYPNITGLPSYPEVGTTPRLLLQYEEEEEEHSLGSSRATGFVILDAHPNSATIDVKVPADARLWFEGEETRQRGPRRFFQSPPLKTGKEYAYHVKAEWTDKNGKKVECQETIDVRAGVHVTLDLRKPKSRRGKSELDDTRQRTVNRVAMSIL